MTSVYICPVCGYSNFRVDRGRRYCIRCGLEVYDRYLGAVVIDTRQDFKPTKRRRLERTVRIVNILSEHLSIPNPIYEYSLDIAREIISNMESRERISPYLLAIISIKIASIKLKNDIRIARLMEATRKIFNINFSRKRLNRMIAEALSIFKGRFKIHPLDTEIYIEETIDRMLSATSGRFERELYEEMMELSIDIYRHIRHLINRNYSPRVMAAICILLAWNSMAKKWIGDSYIEHFTLPNVCKYLDISPYTVKKRLREILKSGAIPISGTFHGISIYSNSIR